ncbi:hypothetical protein [Candidatus Roseilinea sp. NK_OTU-006]|jgi:hypothetical protein|uniref:hypothetical protein n=1 Tax=Candidatus Roseilinea sp. NK_OTU-006 TaxID=2704250 RepID=UPI00145F3893|nr:hypothetical protein [Candidatus Roseilinea sp. NK_OTU-006]
MNITSYELDDIARSGLDALRLAVDGAVDGSVLKRAELTLKLLGKSQSRMSAETNRMALAFRIAKHVQADREQVASMLAHILPPAETQQPDRQIASGGQKKGR